MKKLRVLFVVSAISLASFLNAQVAYINKVDISPPNPTEDDTVIFAVDVVIQGIHLINRGFSENGKVIRYEFCYGKSDNTGGAIIKDTFLLKKPADGTYTFETVLYQSSSIVTCSPVDSSMTVDSFYVAAAVSLAEQQLLKQLRVYPNPAKSYLQVESFEEIEIKEIEIYDLRGKLIRNLNFQHEQKSRIDISELTSGSYIVKLKTNRGEASKQFIVD